MDSTWYVVLLSFLDDVLIWWRKPKFPAPTIKVALKAMPLLKAGGSAPMATALLGTVTLSAPKAGLNITKRVVTVAVGSAAAASFDYLAGPVTFNCNEGDSVTVTAQDTTSGGLASEVASVTLVASDNTTKPDAPAISVSFAPAPAPVVPPVPPAPAPTPAPTPAPAGN